MPMKFRQIRTRTCRVSESGQSLIEVVIAIGVILSVLISIAGLVAINIFGQKKSENKTIASNLAREGIEAIRNFRDTAIVKKRRVEDETDLEYTESSHYYFVTNFNSDNDNRWKLTGGGSGWGSEYNLGLSANNLYEPGGATYTGFKRRITIDSLCLDPANCGAGDAGICDPADGASVCASRIGFRVTSEVQWTENTQTQTVKLVDFLYNWR